jgi:hypothetical protein
MRNSGGIFLPGCGHEKARLLAGPGGFKLSRRSVTGQRAKSARGLPQPRRPIMIFHLLGIAEGLAFRERPILLKISRIPSGSSWFTDRSVNQGGDRSVNKTVS